MTLDDIREKLGLIHVYTGEGKGKTCMALGVALRASGHKLSVYVIQFLKGGGYAGEYLVMDKLPGFYVKQFGQKCPWSEKKKGGDMDCGSCRFCFSVFSEDKKRCQQALEHAERVMNSSKYDIVILDEITVAMKKKMIPVEKVVKILKNKPKHVEVILTGRNAPKEILNIADYVTVVDSKKHPFSKGIAARTGIEA